ncbi:MAG: hypothetical protein ABII97_02435 [Patescibacteria group bacterium]
MVKKNFSFLFLFSILTLLLIVFAIFVRVKTYAPKNSEEWKEYKNIDCSYQLSYPASWLIKAKQYKNPCETNKEAKCIASQSVYITNKKPSWLFIWRKRLFNRPPGDIGPTDVTSFYFLCSKNNRYYSSMEDWVIRSWLATNHNPIREKDELGKIKELVFGEVSIPVFIASYPTLSRLHFIYKDHLYDVSYESGSETQLETDKEVLDKIVQSIKLF